MSRPGDALSSGPFRCLKRRSKTVRLKALDSYSSKAKSFSERDTEMFNLIIARDPSPSVRTRAEEILADPPTEAKYERKHFEKVLGGKPHQRALNFTDLGFFGGDTPDNRVEQLKHVARRALTLDENQLNELRQVAEKDEHAWVRNKADWILRDPVDAWYDEWRNYGRPNVMIAHLEQFNENFETLNERQKNAIERMAESDIPVVSVLAQDLLKRLAISTERL